MVDARLEFILWVTDFMKGHWEDPEWGRREAIKVAAIRELAKGLEKKEVGKEIQAIVR